MKTTRTNGFSLVEVMIVVALISLLTALGVLAYQHNRHQVMASALGSDLRIYREAIERCIMDTGQFNLGAPAGQLSPLLKPYIREGNWSATTPVGGFWVVNSQLDGIRLCVGVDGFTSSLVPIELVDRFYDDGDLNSGRIRMLSTNTLVYIVEE